MAQFARIACTIPNGLKIEHPLDASKSAVIEGNGRRMIPQETLIERELWDAWRLAHKDYEAVVKGRITFIGYETKDATEPVVTEGEPVVTEGEPVVTEGEPVVTEGEPVVKTTRKRKS